MAWRGRSPAGDGGSSPVSMAHVVSSDRNAYDRFYFNAHGRGPEPFLLDGIGVYRS